MSKITIICAMDKELTYIVEHLNAKVYDEKFGIYTANVAGHEVSACVCGIGKVNSAMSTQRMIDIFHPDYVINCGIAGGLDKRLSVLDMVIAESATYHDFHPLSLLEEDKNIGTSTFRCDEKLVELATSACDKLVKSGDIKNYIVGKVASGDCFVETNEDSERIRNDFSASVVEMEGAAVSQVCIVNGIKFLVVRSVSDFADDNAGMSYDTFGSLASNQAGKVIENIILAL